MLPDIAVTKTSNTSTIAAQGGSSVAYFSPDETFFRGAGGGGGGGPGFGIPGTCDDQGANDQPAQVDLNCFSRADNVPGRLHLRWTWDDINAWTGSGQTGDACALLDTDNNSMATFAFCVRITNPNGDPNQITEAAGSPVLYRCRDTSADRCASKVFVQTTDPTTVCSVGLVPDEIAGGDDGADVRAECNLKLQDLGQTVNIANVDLLNVCSFPSGSPNSNPFDCVVTPAAGFLVITKSNDARELRRDLRLQASQFREHRRCSSDERLRRVRRAGGGDIGRHSDSSRHLRADGAHADRLEPQLGRVHEGRRRQHRDDERRHQDGHHDRAGPDNDLHIYQQSRRVGGLSRSLSRSPTTASRTLCCSRSKTRRIRTPARRPTRRSTTSDPALLPAAPLRAMGASTPALSRGRYPVHLARRTRIESEQSERTMREIPTLKYQGL